MENIFGNLYILMLCWFTPIYIGAFLYYYMKVGLESALHRLWYFTICIVVIYGVVLGGAYFMTS